MIQPKPRVFVASDTHFNHTMLVNESKRHFKSIEEMNEQMIAQWNKRVSDIDTVYFLGDFAFGRNKEQWKKRLNGNIIYVRGNHDPATVTRITAMEIVFYGKAFLLIHDPNHAADYPHRWVVHGHIHKDGIRDFIALPGRSYANANVEYHKFGPRLLNEVMGMFENVQEAEWIVRG